MEKREMTCITCPLGCALTVEWEENGEIIVTGNTCPRGEQYGKSEILDPRRTVTTTVRVKGKDGDCLVPVKTAGEVPKDKIADCIRAVAEAKVTAPIAIGDVIVENVAGTGVDVVATKGLR